VRKPKAGQTKAQLQAERTNIAHARHVEAEKRAQYKRTHHGHAPPLSKKQMSAILKAGRVAAEARRKGKKPVKPKPRAALASPDFLPAQRGMMPWLTCNSLYPVCAPVAVANHLLAVTGIRVSDHDILMLHRLAGNGESGMLIEDVLQAASEGGTCWPWPLKAFWRAEPDPGVPGLVIGMSLPHGEHAVLSHPDGMVSWGSVMPWEGESQEAWALEWEDLLWATG